MIKNIREGLAVFAARMNEDHLGAYAASCAYFLTMSFVPFVMILLAVSRGTGMDTTSIMNAVISLVPSWASTVKGCFSMDVKPSLCAAYQ